MLRIAKRHFHHLRSDQHLLAATLLPPFLARVADGHSNLVSRPPLIGRTSQRLTSQQQQRGIVIERFAGIPAKLAHCLTKRSEGLGRYLHVQDMTLRGWIS